METGIVKIVRESSVTYRGIEVQIGRHPKTGRLHAFTDASPYFTVAEDDVESLRRRYERCIDNYHSMLASDAAKDAERSVGRKRRG
jgi:hypothetical protein